MSDPYHSIRLDPVLAALIINLLNKEEGAIEILSDWLEERGEERLNPNLPVEVLAFHAIGPPSKAKSTWSISGSGLQGVWEHAWNQWVGDWGRISGIGQNGRVCQEIISQSGGISALIQYVKQCGRLDR